MDPDRPLIAIVDDEQCVRRALQRLMQAAGFRADAFVSGAELLQSLQTNSPACIILDLHMSGMSGFDLQQHLQGQPLPIPVIVITGNDSPDAQQRALRAGAAAYLRKPVDEQALLSAIADVLARKSSSP